MSGAMKRRDDNRSGFLAGQSSNVGVEWPFAVDVSDAAPLSNADFWKPWGLLFIQRDSFKSLFPLVVFFSFFCANSAD
jgi:hypothetical protein